MKLKTNHSVLKYTEKSQKNLSHLLGSLFHVHLSLPEMQYLLSSLFRMALTHIFPASLFNFSALSYLSN